jgi:hypothetical protein
MIRNVAPRCNDVSGDQPTDCSVKNSIVLYQATGTVTVGSAVETI